MATSDRHMHIHRCGCTPEHACPHTCIYVVCMHGASLQKRSLQALKFLELRCWVVKGKWDQGISFSSGTGATQKQTKCQMKPRWSQECLFGLVEQEIFAIHLSPVGNRKQYALSKPLSILLRERTISKAEWDPIKFPQQLEVFLLAKLKRIQPY